MVGASPCSEIVNLAPSDVLSTVPAVVFHLLKADEPAVKSVSNSHSARPVSAGQVPVNNGSQCDSLKHVQVKQGTYSSAGCSWCKSGRHRVGLWLASKLPAAEKT